jgi:hypothetical protein
VDEEKTKMCRFGSGNWFWLSIIAEFAVAGEWHSSSAVHLRKKSVINMIRLLLSVSNWSIIMIGAGGLLLLVVPPPILLPQLQF